MSIAYNNNNSNDDDTSSNNSDNTKNNNSGVFICFLGVRKSFSNAFATLEDCGKRRPARERVDRLMEIQPVVATL